jgi:hypothetical protein
MEVDLIAPLGRLLKGRGPALRIDPIYYLWF